MQIICDENGFVTSFAFIGTLVAGIEVEPPKDEAHFADHFSAYKLVDGLLSFDEGQSEALAKKEEIDNFRHLRETECFPYVNRGQLWYATLSVKQLSELTAWYKAWLKVTETKVVPERPSWLG